MIVDFIITKFYQVLGSMIDTLPGAINTPGWVTSAFSTLGAVGPLFPWAKFSQFLSVYAGLLTLFYTVSVIRWMISR